MREDPQNSEPIIPTPEVNIQDKFSKKLLLYLGIITIFVATGLIYYYFTYYIENDTSTQNKQNLSKDNYSDNAVCIIKDNYQNTTDLNITGKTINLSDRQARQLAGDISYSSVIDPKGYFRNILNIENEIDRYDYSSSSDLLAYSIKEATEGEVTFTVYLHDFALGTTKSIYNESFPKVSGLEKGSISDYKGFLGSLKFNDGGTLLAIGINTDIYMYDVRKDDITLTYKDSNGLSNTWPGVFNDFIFSPNSRKIAVMTGYYEGSSTDILNLDTGDFAGIDYTSYTSGTTIIGWYGDKILINRYNHNYSDNYEDGIYLTDPIPNSPETMLATDDPSSTYRTIRLYGDMVYFVVNDSDSGEARKFCNNSENPYSFGPTKDTLFKYNLETNEISEILTTDSTRVYEVKPGVDINSVSSIDIDGEQRLVVGIDLNNSSNTTGESLFLIEKDSTLTEVVF